MNTILQTIVHRKRQEIEVLKSTITENEFENSPHYKTRCFSISKQLLDPMSSGIIAEFKRKSPSKGWIHKKANVSEIISSYQTAGVAAISCLTDELFFGGSIKDFELARKSFHGPILRKDFIIDPIQIHQSKAIGADVILLIAAILTKEEIVELTNIAHSIGLEVLLELHHNSELEKIYERVNILGINNRDLHDFSVSLLTSIDLKRRLPENSIVISESGLEHPGIVCDLFQYGFRGFLIGEHFMKHIAPGDKAKKFIEELQDRKSKHSKKEIA